MPSDPDPLPSDPGLQAAEEHFSEGDFRSARRLAESALRADAAEVRANAQEILDRMRPDPAALWMAIGCLVLLSAVVYFTLFHFTLFR